MGKRLAFFAFNNIKKRKHYKNTSYLYNAAVINIGRLEKNTYFYGIKT